jgi:hypothetical protein
MSGYPIEEVCSILEIPNEPHLGGIRWFRDATEAQIRQLIALGAANPESGWNEAPALGDLLAAPGYKCFDGYVVYPPREDARVTIDGLTVRGLLPDEAWQLHEQWSNADDLRIEDELTRTVSAWWD